LVKVAVEYRSNVLGLITPTEAVVSSTFRRDSKALTVISSSWVAARESAFWAKEFREKRRKAGKQERSMIVRRRRIIMIILVGFWFLVGHIKFKG